MSAEALGWAFKRSPYTSDWYVVHLCVADATDDMDGNTFALSIPALARKARCSDRTVQYALRDMEAHNLVTKVSPGGGRGNPAIYRFEFPAIETVQDVHPSGNGANRRGTSGSSEHERAQDQPLAVAPFPPAPIRKSAAARPTVDDVPLTKAERDAIWDAVAAACGGEWSQKLVGASRGRMASGVADIIKLGCRTPEEVKRRAAVYRSKYRGADLTPTALAANWPSLVPERDGYRAAPWMDYA